MKEVYIETWEQMPVFVGRIYKVDVEKLAEENQDPDILSLEGEDLDEYIFEQIDSSGGIDEICSPVISTENYGDPQMDMAIFTSKKDALERIEWRGFRRGEPYHMTDENGESVDWDTKTKILADLEEELAEE